MSHLSKVFNKVPVKVQKRSGFDLSHENLFSAKIGTLIPASVEEVMPGDVISIGGACSVELPPLATNFKGRVDAKLEAFFVPNRIVWAGWQNFITQDVNSISGNQVTGNTGGSGVSVPNFSVPTSVPVVNLPTPFTSACTLTDYLGCKGRSAGSAWEANALPFLAYKKIFDDWYRDSNIQQPFFNDGYGITSAAFLSAPKAAYMPYFRDGGTLSATGGTHASSNSLLGMNGDGLWMLNQRNFMKDYFTTMTYEPQAGAAAQMVFSVDSATTTAGFSIAQLRAANSLQRWLERNNIAGTRYYDQILAHYGVLPPDATFQRPVLLGSMTTPVIVNSISKTNQSAAATTEVKNPYSNSTAAQFGKGTAFGKDSLVDSFEVKEHGYIFVLFSLVPHAYYSTGSRKYMSRIKSSDYAFPEFANIGDEPVFAKQLASNFTASTDGDRVVGYVQRYADYKYHDDEVHGLLADGQSLANFVLQRGFDSGVTLGSSLLQIPTDYLDSVMITSSNVSGFNAIVDCYFDSKVLRPLPEYSLPSLCNDEGQDGKKVFVPKGGTRL